MTWPAPSFVDVKVSLSVLVIDTATLTPAAASAWLNCSSVLTVAAPPLRAEAVAPSVMVVVPVDVLNANFWPASTPSFRSEALTVPVGDAVAPVNSTLLFVL
jgi:hypothetical protein